MAFGDGLRTTVAVSCPPQHTTRAPHLTANQTIRYARQATTSTVRPIIAVARRAEWASRPVAMQSQEAITASAGGSLAKSRVIKNGKGLFRIRHVRDIDLIPVAQLQATSFHEALPLKPLDKLAFKSFQAEVLSAVLKKTKVLSDDSFAILVVESCSPAAHSWPEAAISNQGSGWQSAVWYGNHTAALQQYSTPCVHGSSSSSSSSSSNGDVSCILGVIEVGKQDEHDVLQYLSPGTETYAYISSMAVAPHMRRCGIGTALLHAAEQQAVLWGQQLLALHVHDSNATAIKLYRSHGLKQQAADPVWRKYVGGKVRQLMVKWL